MSQEEGMCLLMLCTYNGEVHLITRVYCTVKSQADMQVCFKKERQHRYNVDLRAEMTEESSDA